MVSGRILVLLITSHIPWILFFVMLNQREDQGVSNPVSDIFTERSNDYNTAKSPECEISATECMNLRMNGVMPNQDDPLLAKYVRDKLLIPPNYDTPYNLSKPVTAKETFSLFGQVDAVNEFLKNATNGFFVDCGAHDGEFQSNTIWLEKMLGWTGILIEVDPNTFKDLQSKNRKSWLANVCLSPSIYPGMQTYYLNGENLGSIGSGLTEITYGGPKRKAQMYCLPLYSILLALNQPVVDLFSLDIEGAELDILKTIPFDKILIKSLIIEHSWIPKVEGRNGFVQLKEFMNGKNYKLFKIIRDQDSIYVHGLLLPIDFVEAQDPINIR